jgi:hypothetical protein
MASPVYQTVSGNSGTATSFTATEPTSTVSGDGLLLFVFLDTNPSGWTPPAGWIEKGATGGTTVTDGTNTFQAYIYAIERGGSAPALGGSWTGSHYFEWTIVRVNGILSGGSAAFVESVTSATPGSGSAPDSPSATPLSANTLAISSAWSWAGFTGSQAVPGGYTSIRQVLNTGNAQAFKTLATTAAENPAAWGSGTTAAIWANTIILASVAAGGPTISSQPSDTQVASGATASFSVTASASGGGSLSYQWKLNGTNVSTGSGGTTSSYTTGSLALSDSGGLYSCDVTETGGSSPGTTTTTSATLTVGIARIAVGTTAYTATGTPTTIAPAWPTTAILAGSVGKVLLIIGMKPATSGAGSVTTPSSPWSLLGNIQAAGGYTAGGASAADTGNCDLYVYSADDPGTTAGTLSVTVNVGATNGVAWAKMLRYSAPSGTTFSLAMATGSDTSAGNVSIAFGSDPGVAAGDYCVGAMCIPTDVTTPAQFSAEAFSQTGVTFGTVTEIEEQDSSNNFDIGGFIVDALATAGPSSASPTMTATAGGTTTNVRGPGVFVRLRAASSGVTGTGSGAEQSFAASGSGAESFAGTGSAAESPFTPSATGVETFTGGGSAARSPFASSASGSVANFNGPAAAAPSSFAAAAVGVLAFIATGSAALSSFAASASGAEAFSGACTASASPFAAGATGTQKFTATGSAAAAPFACAGVGAEAFACSGSAAASPFAVSASGAQSFAGTCSAACSPFAASGAGTTGNVTSGAAACALSSFAASAAGLEAFTASASAAASPFASSCSGTEKFTSTASNACQPFAASGSGATGNVIAGSATAAIAAFASAGTGSEVFAGTASAARPAFTLSAAAAELFAGTCAAACSPFGAGSSGSNLQAISGAAVIACSPFALDGSGSALLPISGTCTAALSPFNCNGAQAIPFAPSLSSARTLAVRTLDAAARTLAFASLETSERSLDLATLQTSARWLSETKVVDP